MDPGLANAEGSGLAEDVASADWVILTGLWDGWLEPNTSGEYGSDAPNQVLARPLLRGRLLRGRPRRPLPPLPLTGPVADRPHESSTFAKRRSLAAESATSGAHFRSQQPPARSAEREAAPDGAGQVAEHGEERAERARHPHGPAARAQRRRPSPSATAVGVVANGAAFMPGVIGEWTKPGRTTSTLAPVPASASPRPWAKPSRPAFDEP